MKLFTLFLATLFFINSICGQDLILDWATNIKGDGSHRFAAITTDNSGNFITAGSFKGTTDFDPSGAVFNLTPLGNQNDIYIQKLDSDGNLLWAKSFESDGGSDTVRDVITDAEGNIYIGGDFHGQIDVDPFGDVVSFTSPDPLLSNDGFLVKLDKDGKLLWAITYSSNEYNAVQTILVDGENQIYVVGGFSGEVDFDPGPSEFLLNGGGDGFITKLDEDGNFLWAKSIGGPAAGLLHMAASTMDLNGNIIATGGFRGEVDLDPGPESEIFMASAEMDIYVLKLDNDGNFLWGKSFESSDEAFGFDITTDLAGDIILTGRFLETADFDPGPAVSESISNGAYDVFLTKLNSNGDLIWNRTYGGTGSEESWKILTDEVKNIYVTGFFEKSTDFDPQGDGFTLFSTGMNDYESYFIKLDADANFLWAKSFGGSEDEEGRDAVMDAAGSIYLHGTFEGTADLHPEPDELFNLAAAGNSDSYFIKLSPAVSPTSTQNILADEVSIYPNPTSGNVTIELENLSNSTIAIYNLLGQLILKKQAVHYKLEVNLNQPKGIYFVEIENGERRFTTKLIVNQN